MTASTASTAAKSYRKPALIVAAATIAVLAYFWFQPSAADEARLAMLEADPTLVLPPLAGETAELVETGTNVASRSWDGDWSVTERTDRYNLLSRRVNRYAPDLVAHMDASDWDVTQVRCQEDRLVISGRQLIDGDWATLEFTAWAVGPNGQLSVRAAINAVAGESPPLSADVAEIELACDNI